MRLISAILLIIISCLQIGCKTILNCKTNLEKETSDSTNWYYDSVKNHYISNFTFLKHIKDSYKNCLIGKDTIFVSNIFGKNYQFSDSTMIFPLSKPCTGSGKDYHCTTLDFIIDSNGLVKQFSYSTLHMRIYH